MHTGKFRQLLAAALCGLGPPAAALADPGDVPRPGSSSIFSQWLGHGTPARPAPSPRDTFRPPPKPVEDPLSKARSRELENWLRRTDVCVRLMQVADETNDDALRKKAEDLERRARTTYERRIAELNGDTTDEQLLDGNSTKGKSGRSAGLFSLFRGNDRAAPIAPEGGSR